MAGKEQNCYILDGTVTSLCMKMPANNMCMSVEVPKEFMILSGTLTTTNIIMANWQKSMWQDVMNRAARSLSSGPFRTNFMRASIKVN
ncbi:hypothetical protein DICVIV_14081 [Dictyocaulus viviparus]|uniref:Uncharacterized protein n=1 Tax=Dictyocaulus viviparus TaxID=29172 RepID=A0A0D8XC07_DICVI|nr:hypothetical protein DICVIV_14081 [Dictyocaulus viviparus]